MRALRLWAVLKARSRACLDGLGVERGPLLASVEPEDAGEFEEIGDIVSAEMITGDLLQDEKGRLGLVDAAGVSDLDASGGEDLGDGDGGGGIFGRDDADGSARARIFAEQLGDVCADEMDLTWPLRGRRGGAGREPLRGEASALFSRRATRGFVFGGEAAFGAGDPFEAEALFQGFDPFALEGVGGKARRGGVDFERLEFWTPRFPAGRSPGQWAASQPRQHRRMGRGGSASCNLRSKETGNSAPWPRKRCRRRASGGGDVQLAEVPAGADEGVAGGG